MADMARQGDVLVKKCDCDVSGLREIPRENGAVVLAHGEVTGHMHAFREDNVKMYSANDNSGRVFIVISGRPATLFHEEHAPITFAPGVYEVIRQREWTDRDEPVIVAD